MLLGMRFAAGAAASLFGLAGTALAQEAEVRETQDVDVEIVQVQADEAPRTVLALEYRNLANLVAGDQVVDAANQAVQTYAVQVEAGSGLWLGVQLAQELPPALAHHLGEKKGALVESVYPDSPAADAGIEAYDLIVVLGENAIDSHEALVEAMQSAEEKPIDVVVLRGGNKKTISVTPRKRKAPESTEAQFQDPFLYAVPHARVLPALQGEQAGAIRHRLVTTAEGAGPLPENIESLKVQWERNGDKVTPKYEVVTADGQVFKASTDEEIQALPEEIRKVLPQGPHTTKFAIRLDAVPQAGRTTINMMPPGFAPTLTPPPAVAVPRPAPQAGVAIGVAPPMLAQPPQQLVVPAWADVYRNGAPGAAPQAHIFMNNTAQPSTQLDDLKAEIQKLNGALERIEKLLQKDD